jgi:hypothetical protein
MKFFVLFFVVVCCNGLMVSLSVDGPPTGQLLYSTATWVPHIPASGDDVLIDLGSDVVCGIASLVVDVSTPVMRSFYVTAKSNCSTSVIVNNDVVLSANDIRFGNFTRLMLLFNAQLIAGTIMVDQSSIVGGLGTLTASISGILNGLIIPGGMLYPILVCLILILLSIQGSTLVVQSAGLDFLHRVHSMAICV